jgi:hypothetical protein
MTPRHRLPAKEKEHSWQSLFRMKFLGESLMRRLCAVNVTECTSFEQESPRGRLSGRRAAPGRASRALGAAEPLCGQAWLSEAQNSSKVS